MSYHQLSFFANEKHNNKLIFKTIEDMWYKQIPKKID